MRIMFQLDKNPGIRFVMLDETYCHTTHNKNKMSIRHEDEDPAKMPRMPSKGPRVCIISAIISKKKKSDNRRRNNHAQILTSTTTIFSATESKKDYHGNFTSDLFCKWFETKLIPDVKEKTEENERIVFVMDNAAYHTAYDKQRWNLPSPKDKVSEYYRKLKEIIEKTEAQSQVKIQESDTKKVLSSKFKLWKSMYLKPKIVELAEKENMRVVFTPPYTPTLQPIELLWARVKDDAAKSYKQKRNMANLMKDLHEAFNTANENDGFIDRLFKHCAKNGKDMWAKDFTDENKDEQNAENEILEDMEENNTSQLVDDEAENEEGSWQNGVDGDVETEAFDMTTDADGEFPPADEFEDCEDEESWDEVMDEDDEETESERED